MSYIPLWESQTWFYKDCHSSFLRAIIRIWPYVMLENKISKNSFKHFSETATKETSCGSYSATLCGSYFQLFNLTAHWQSTNNVKSYCQFFSNWQARLHWQQGLTSPVALLANNSSMKILPMAPLQTIHGTPVFHGTVIDNGCSTSCFLWAQS